MKAALNKFYRNYRQTILTLVFVVILGGGFGAWSVVHHKTASSDPQQELSSILTKVGRLMFLPIGERPTLATVDDASKLKNRAIFAKAQNGDKVLIYTKAQKIIIYRPNAGKIVDVNPLIADKKGSPYITSSIAILNGSGNDSLLDKMTRSVVSDFPNTTIVQKDVAPRLFPTSIAIDLSKKNQPLDEQIADTLGIKTGQIPLGVNVSNSDFLIIIGQDYK